MNLLSKSKQSLINNVIVFCTIFLLVGCAQETAPTGGAKDMQPPIALRSKPNNQQTNFSEKMITITFDEFVVLKDAANQVVISPQILPKPTFSTKGKSVVVNLKKCELQPNTTYNIFFGDAIQDLHEGNIVTNFHYVFSTGEWVDSLSLNGFVINAFEGKKQEGVTVMLYRNINDTIPFDSLPYRIHPQYICRSKKDGSFDFCNVAQNSYKIFALKDENRNFLYDLPNEMIAFYDTLVSPYYTTDSSLHHLSATQDSAYKKIDSSTLFNTSNIPHQPIHLFLFTEIDSTVKLKEVKVIDSLQAQFLFSYETKNPQFRLLSPDSASDSLWMIKEWNPTFDTLTAWFPSFISDTLKIEISNDNQVIDTVTVALKKSPKPRGKNKNEETPLQSPASLPALKVMANAAGTFPFFNVFKLTFTTPLTYWNFDSVVFTTKKDTLKTPSFHYNEKKREAVCDYSFAEETDYSIIIPKGAFENIIGQKNDTLRFSFTTDDASQYGTLKLHIDFPEIQSQMVVQLMTEDETKVIKEQMVQKSGIIEFGYIDPKKVKVKAILDSNKNGKWDAGNYLHKIQPERVYIFEKTINIRAYWDVEESWTITL